MHGNKSQKVLNITNILVPFGLEENSFGSFIHSFIYIHFSKGNMSIDKRMKIIALIDSIEHLHAQMYTLFLARLAKRLCSSLRTICGWRSCSSCVRIIIRVSGLVGGYIGFLTFWHTAIYYIYKS